MSEYRCKYCGEPLPPPGEYHIDCWVRSTTGLTRFALEMADHSAIERERLTAQRS